MLRLLLVGVVVFGVPVVPARAELIDLGNGMIYDTIQDLTWLQNANYVQTSGADADGLMIFAEAFE